MMAVVGSSSVPSTTSGTTVGDLLHASSSAANQNSATLDERLVAQAALEAAEDALESLCAVHAGTFVAVEKRGRTVQEALHEMTTTVIPAVQAQVVQAQEVLAQDDDDEGRRGAADAGEGDVVATKMVDASKLASAASTSLAVLSERHRIRRRTLLQHSALLELLELPSLMDACVRSNMYEEALSIASTANGLERGGGGGSSSSSAADASHNNSMVVVAQVVQQIRSRQAELRRHLLRRLETSVTMPECLEVVTALRRLNSIDLERQGIGPTESVESVYYSMEMKLQIDFLEARDVWLDSITMTTTTSSSSSSVVGGSKYLSSSTASTTASSTAATTPAGGSEEILDTIERYRTRVFEIATQFNAIFRANVTSGASSYHKPISAFGSNTTSPSTSLMENLKAADLLTLWIVRKTQTFQTLLQQGLLMSSTSATGTSSLSATSGTDAATLRDILEATYFFASSMGRLGADFTASSRLSVLMERTLVDIVTLSWKEGVKVFGESLQICQQANVATPLGTVADFEAALLEMKPSTEPASATSTSGDDFISSPHTVLDGQTARSPPRVLLQVPPLGRLVNAILAGLNELRRCFLPAVWTALEQAMEEQVTKVVATQLRQLERSTLVPGVDKGLREMATLYSQLWNEVVKPYCQGSLAVALGTAAQGEEYYDKVREGLLARRQKLQDVIDAAKRAEEEAAAAAAAAEAEAAAAKAAAEQQANEEEANGDEDNEEQADGDDDAKGGKAD